MFDATEQVRASRAKDTLQKMNELIGFFQLDPKRVLDIFFDIFARHLEKSHAFYMRILEYSTWFTNQHEKTKFISDFSNVVGFKFEHHIATLNVTFY